MAVGLNNHGYRVYGKSRENSGPKCPPNLSMRFPIAIEPEFD
jgi:hypothetical protein